MRNSPLPLCWAVVIFIACAVQAEPPSSRHLLVSVPASSARIQQWVDAGLDLWNVRDGMAELRVSAEELIALRAEGLDPIILDPDVYESAAKLQRPTTPTLDPWTQYHDLTTTYAFLDQLHNRYPDITAVVNVGTSVEGRAIKAIRISDQAATVDPNEPATLICGCHHAREWISVEVPLYLAEKLCQQYATGPDVRRLVDGSEIWIVPVVNPDGLNYTYTNDRYWRKNRRNNGGSYGVDLNRNYSYGWGGSGSSSDPQSEIYRGPSAFSEPETRAIRDLYEGTTGRSFNTLISYHSFSQLLLSPWGYTYTPPPDGGRHIALGMSMVNLINNAHTNSQYDYVNESASALYLASGDTVDWAYGTHGTTAYTIELRPSSGSYYGFNLPTSQILATCQENLPAALYLMEWTLPNGSSFIVESRSSGQNYNNYGESGSWAGSTAKSWAKSATPGIGSRWASMDRETYGICRATYQFTPPATGQYEVYVTWPASTNAGSGVEHIITHAEGTTSILANQNVSLNPAGANLWNSFGRYNLRGGTMYTVSQTNENYSEAGKVFLADAVRWELVSLIAEPPVMISAVSRKMHGDTGVFDINIGGTGGVECRQGGATQVMVVFDKNIQLTTGTTNDVQTTLGTVTSLAAGGTSLTIQLTAAGPGAVTLSFPGVADATNPGAVVTDTLCFRSLPGDVQPSGSINVFDLLAIKGNINQAVTDATFTSDVNADGLINVLDLLVARNGLNTSIPPCP